MADWSHPSWRSEEGSVTAERRAVPSTLANPALGNSTIATASNTWMVPSISSPAVDVALTVITGTKGSEVGGLEVKERETGA